jgi:glutamate/tyrosine decarboxylase-like PLP-dependent enzyme
MGVLPGGLPNYLVPATAHYSWPKAGSLLGLGGNQMQRVAVDEFGRLDVGKLEAILRERAENKVRNLSPKFFAMLHEFLSRIK